LVLRPWDFQTFNRSSSTWATSPTMAISVRMTVIELFVDVDVRL
jgi:hypothetical protein